ncbi:MAG: bis(5'-nucleosyl)-tetraphosphatase (symmetrical) YqeK [Clostridia bacterium]|nr:bis(5'-nucleosyl)-tetraphosphatase (symmetrical) YqeK [Clostridia bacterium]
MEIADIIERLKNVLEKDRFMHSVNVMETSVSLAAHYGVDVQQARLAGILHDCGKNYKGDEARDYIKHIGYEADELELLQTRLLHGVIGEHLAKTVYGVEDAEVLGAIRWHTTGKAGMSLLEKIVYVADYIEPLRSFDGVEDMRKAAYENLDQAVVLCSDSTIRYILKKGFLLHEKTVQTRNHSLLLLRKQNKS